jgi:hypothetical protein
MIWQGQRLLRGIFSMTRCAEWAWDAFRGVQWIRGRLFGVEVALCAFLALMAGAYYLCHSNCHAKLMIN